MTVPHYQTVSLEGIARIKAFEACLLVAYLDEAGIPTIGWGTIRYPEGKKVRLGDTCTQARADECFRHDLARFELSVDALTVDHVTQRQFDSLTSFAYNCGDGEDGYRGSTLRRTVNASPADPKVRTELMKWHFTRGKPSRGLWKRRHAEADWYFGVTTALPDFPHPA